MTRRWTTLLAAAIWGMTATLAWSQAAPTSATAETETTDPMKKYRFEKQADGTEWAQTPWGKLGAAHLATAPFPDESRTTGFVTRKGDVFPYEGHYDDDRVAIAVPKQMLGRRSGSIDLIVHYHGHLNECLHAVEQFRLGEQLAASGCRAVLVVPQGPKFATDSGGGKHERPQAFAAFISELEGVISRSGVLGTTQTKVRHIILSGHSGAYRVMGCILDHGGEWDRIREVWLFDAAYGKFDELALPGLLPDKAQPKYLRSIYTDHLAPENSQIMARLFLAGIRPAIVFDDLLTTEPHLVLRTGGGREIRLPGKSLEDLLAKEPYLFIYTSLTHNGVSTARRYFERFARSSPFLAKVRSRQ